MSTNSKWLRQFYGLETKNSTEDEKDINSPSFNPHKYFTDSIATDSVPNLLAKENTFLSEIKSYESDLQGLVYGNYQKFLTAADTVQELGSNINDLKSKIEDLSTHIETMSRKNQKVSQKLDPNRQKVARLVGISRLLQRVKFIANLPAQLNLCLEQEKYATAVNAWSKVETILSTQLNFPSFHKIHEECSAIMEEIKTQIRGQMLNTDISVQDSVESALLLIRLKTPLGLICSQLGHHRFLVIDNTLEYQEKIDDPFKALEVLDETVLEDAKTFIQLFKEKLIPLEKGTTTKVDGVLSDFMTNTFQRIIQFLSIEELYSLNAQKLAEYLVLFDKHIGPIATPEQLSRHTHRTLQQYTEARAMEVYNRLEKTLQSDDEISVENILNTITEPVLQLIDEFVVLAQKHSECGQYLMQQIQLMLVRVLELFKKANPKNALFLGLSASILGERELQKIFTEVLKIEPDLPPVMSGLAINCKATANACLNSFVSHRRKTIDQQLIDGFAQIDWFTDEDPTGPSKPVEEFLNIVNDLYSQLFKTLEAKIPRSPYKSSIFNSGTPNFSGIRNTNDVIASMFASVNSLKLGREISFDTNQIITSITMYGTKTILELVRNTPLSTKGFNQIQIDCYCLYSMLKEKVESADVFGTLVEEITFSAAEQTPNPQPLDTSTLSSKYIEYSSRL